MKQIGLTIETIAKVRLWRRTIIPVAVLALMVASITLGLSRLGHWLVVADPLDHARAIVVLSGHVPFRAIEAASIYRQGWAPEVWLTKAERPAEEAALARLGIRYVQGEDYSREVLERLGVPLNAIRLMDEGIKNTAEEVKLIGRELKRIGGEKVILVTSKPHSRRVRATWRKLVGDSLPAIVQFAREDPYQADRWWWHTRDALAVSREVFGMMNVWAGFPVQPERRG